jgi:acetyl-CoA C-acetyltransferase
MWHGWRARSSCRTSPSAAENFCATGSEALRGAAYAVASGAYDSAMAIGVEKVKDSGYQGLVGAGKTPTDGTGRTLTAAAMFAMCVPAYAKRYGVDAEEMREVLAHISVKNHYNGARNPRAQFRREVSTETICASPLMAGDLRVYDCSGVADGSAAAVVVRAEDAHKYTDSPLYIKALSFVAGNCSGNADPDYDYTSFLEIGRPPRAAAQAGVTDPRHGRDGRGATVSHLRSCSSWRTSGSPNGAQRGRKSSPARSTSTASSP